MSESLPHDDIHTHVVSAALRRFGARIALFVVVVGVAVGGYAYLRPHSYKADTTVLLLPLSGNALAAQTSASSQSTSVAMQTESSLVTSLAVTQRVNAALNSDLNAGSGATASVPANSQIVRITCLASTARDAQRRAQAYAQAFLDYRSDLAARSQKAQLGRLNARLVSVQQQLSQALTDKARKNPPADADTRARVATSNLVALQSSIGEVQSASTEPGNVITPAARPSTPAGLSPALLTGGGVLAAVVLALAVALWRERTDDRIRARAEATILGLPVLAVLPDANGENHRPEARANLEAVRAEALRRARTGLLAVAPIDSVIAVAGLTSGEPAVSTATDLARSMAAAGYRVALVDAATAEESRSGSATVGLSDLLSNDDPLPERLPLRTVNGVVVLSAGSEPAAGSERYAGQRTGVLLRRLQEDVDYVLVAAPPAGTAEGMALMLAVERLVLIATDRLSTHAELAATTTAVERLGAVVAGYVIRERREPRRKDKVPRSKTSESPKPTLEQDSRSTHMKRHLRPTSRSTRDVGAREAGLDSDDPGHTPSQDPTPPVVDNRSGQDAAGPDEHRSAGAPSDDIAAASRTAAGVLDDVTDEAETPTSDHGPRTATSSKDHPGGEEAESAVVPTVDGRKLGRARGSRGTPRANQGIGRRREQDG